MYTISQWVIIAIVAIIIVICISAIITTYESLKVKIATIVIGLIVMILVFFGFHWYNTSTASGIRSLKDFKSNLSNGIEREITITAEDGRQIFHYEGKVDVESNHVDNYIKFESEQGKRYLIYYGVQDTISIIEK